MTSPLRRTLAEPVRFEPDKIKGSRHIARLAPVADESEAHAVVAQARAEIPTAGHHAFAWRLGADGQHVRASDDGEPSGSAGRPILGVLEHADLIQVVAVVSRIFGGTRLGVGGLVRAYSGAVIAALDHARIVPVQSWVQLRIGYGWPFADAVERCLQAYEIRRVERDYSDRISVTLELPDLLVDRFSASLADATNGSVEITAMG